MGADVERVRGRVQGADEHGGPALAEAEGEALLLAEPGPGDAVRLAVDKGHAELAPHRLQPVVAEFDQEPLLAVPGLPASHPVRHQDRSALVRQSVAPDLVAQLGRQGGEAGKGGRRGGGSRHGGWLGRCSITRAGNARARLDFLSVSASRTGNVGGRVGG